MKIRPHSFNQKNSSKLCFGVDPLSFPRPPEADRPLAERRESRLDPRSGRGWQI